MAKLFKEPATIFNWKDVKTFLLRNQYNEALHVVIRDYFTKQYTSGLPNFLNTNYCLTLTKFGDQCNCGDTPNSKIVNSLKSTSVKEEEVEIENLKSELKIRKMKLDFEWKKILQKEWAMSDVVKKEFEQLDNAIIKDSINIKALFTALTTSKTAKKEFIDALNNDLQKVVDEYDKKKSELTEAQNKKREEDFKIQNEEEERRINYQDALESYLIAQRNFDFHPTQANQKIQADAKNHFEQIQNNAGGTSIKRSLAVPSHCQDQETMKFCLPPFEYLRKLNLSVPIKDKSGNQVPESDFDFTTHGLTVGSVMWLYYYERMGIFKILGTLMDDYNYRGKYTISGNRKDSNGNPNSYSTLMDMVCTWHRLGMSSNLRDRICLYQRVLGVSIENNLGVESERNTGFMGTFNKLLDYMLEYYKDKRLAVAINNSTIGRSSVATQTSIKDTINLLRQQFEPFQYGRNQINTFLGIATVHATICLLYNIRKEIGVPDQYESPEEFIPAAYDILVAKRSVTLNETNRFIVHDNCASYGYRLLTDLETADLTQFQPVATGGVLDLWLDDVEGWVEGYRNAYSSISERVEAIV